MGFGLIKKEDANFFNVGKFWSLEGTEMHVETVGDNIVCVRGIFFS